MKKSTYLEVGVDINDLVPARAIHPGEVLREELKSRKITQKQFSEMTGILPSQINEVIKEKRGISADNALKIGKALKMDAILWAKFQMFYELDLARIKQKNENNIVVKKESKNVLSNR
jgi:HTH-type transcriptional regulator/antitoxin HigA